MTMLTGADEPGGGGDRSVTKLDCLASQVSSSHHQIASWICI